jgi:hypothetical protein
MSQISVYIYDISDANFIKGKKWLGVNSGDNGCQVIMFHLPPILKY